ncbi:hypothetical protein [Pseudomonas syringae]|uniref:hypothetical protein n=1 Tax=Pseudomonas syringae TaxID=317 RepID=UPI001F39C251|nr:hypothetical protein [Pseudomonas syringae]MCF5736475.1 hypothetical protein [Pseudomonas syringae]MCF5741503.1 hypothetical protein [Pseudomonas syringae]MCF5751520.1 hypothetical protein [Pseudomonas syringae]MCF5756963.1 hypothetical protein [Pseudomonas syringae]
MTHLFEQNHGARIVRQASPGAVSFEPQASSLKPQASSFKLQASSFKHFDLLLLLAFIL